MVEVTDSIEREARAMRAELEAMLKEAALLRFDIRQIKETTEYRDRQIAELESNVRHLKIVRESAEEDALKVRKEIDEISEALDRMNAENDQLEKAVNDMTVSFEKACVELTASTKKDLSKFFNKKIAQLRAKQCLKADKIDLAIDIMELDVDLSHLQVPTIRSIIHERTGKKVTEKSA